MRTIAPLRPVVGPADPVGAGDSAHPAACPVCDGETWRVPFGGRMPWLQRCGGCGIGRTWPQPSDAELAETYDADYYRTFGYATGDGDAYRRLKQAWGDRLLRLAERHLAPGRLLDVGSALGDLLCAGARRGWTGVGLEPNPFAAAEADRVAPGATVCAAVEGYLPARRDFDLITCNDVFEHLRRPETALEQFRHWLRPGGLLILTTIDAGSLAARLLGRRWVHYHRDHLWYFTRPTLMRLARSAGLDVLACRPARKIYHLRYLLEILAYSPNFAMVQRGAAALGRRLPRGLACRLFTLREGLLLLARRPLTMS